MAAGKDLLLILKGGAEMVSYRDTYMPLMEKEITSMHQEIG